MNKPNTNSGLYAQLQISLNYVHEFQGNPLETVRGDVFTRHYPYMVYRGKIIKGP